MKNKKLYIIIAAVALIGYLLWRKNKQAVAAAAGDGTASGSGTAADGSSTAGTSASSVGTGAPAQSSGTIPSNVPVYSINRFIARSGGPTSQGWDAIAQVSPTVAQNFKVGDKIKFPGSTKYTGTYNVYYKYSGSGVVNLYFDTQFAGDDANARLVKA